VTAKLFAKLSVTLQEYLKACCKGVCIGPCYQNAVWRGPAKYAELNFLLMAEVGVVQSRALFYGAAILQILTALALHEWKNVLLVRPLAYAFSLKYPKCLYSYELRNKKSINITEEKATVREQFTLILTLKKEVKFLLCTKSHSKLLPFTHFLCYMYVSIGNFVREK
jgi:hypothetical protein